jgi:hypothetical protein
MPGKGRCHTQRETHHLLNKTLLPLEHLNIPSFHFKLLFFKIINKKKVNYLVYSAKFVTVVLRFREWTLGSSRPRTYSFVSSMSLGEKINFSNCKTGT